MAQNTVSQTLFVENLISALRERSDRLTNLVVDGTICNPRSAENISERIIEIETCIQIIESTANTMKIAT